MKHEYLNIGNDEQLITAEDANRIACLLDKASFDLPEMRHELQEMANALYHRVGIFMKKDPKYYAGQTGEIKQVESPTYSPSRTLKL